MHVALVSPGWPLKHHPNGVVTYVHWLRQELARQGHRVSVFTGLLAEPEEGVYLVRPSFGYRASVWLESKRRSPRFAVLRWGEAIAGAVRRVHRMHPIDVIEMEESFGWAADVMRYTSIPTVVKLHGPAFISLLGEELKSPFAKAKIEREGVALRRVQVLTAPARRTLQATIERYRLTPQVSRTIVNPLSLPASAPLWHLGRCDRTKLLFVGRFDELKGGDLVLQAFARLLATNPTLTLVFVGFDSGVPGSDGRTIQFDELKSSLFSSDEAARVDYRGKLTPEEIYSLRAEALVTIVASRQENQSYTALEAMLQGCPLVSSDAGGQGEIIADCVTGLLAATGSAEDLAEKLQTLIDDPSRAAELGSNARSHVLVHHCPVRVVAQTLAAYGEAAALEIRGRSAAKKA